MKKSRSVIDLFPCVKLLLKHGADVNFVSKYGDTPLTYALEYSACPGNIAVELIEAGADVNLSWPRDGMTPLMLAAVESCYMGNERYVCILLRSGAKINILNKWRECSGDF